MKPRITFSLDADGCLDIWLNPAGRDLLVEQLQHLSETSDHFHFGPHDFSEVEVSTIPYHPGDRTLEWGKVMFRTDEWDARYFPHVLEPAGPSDPAA